MMAANYPISLVNDMEETPIISRLLFNTPHCVEVYEKLSCLATYTRLARTQRAKRSQEWTRKPNVPREGVDYCTLASSR